ncbi:MAG TPA: hypothetical protein VEB22_11240 [Phycisphaerales bacterium]|nr:hypothetical protein [Phycisphaerales bacterium]
MPDRAPTGPLAYFLPCLLLTITGVFTQAGGTGVPVYRDQLPYALIESLDWGQAWHGTVLSGDHILGGNLPTVEFVAGGFQTGQLQQSRFPAANGNYPFSITLALPACDGRGGLVRDTAQLALCYQPSQVKINMADASVVSAVSPGSSFSSLTLQLTAVLDARQELVLGTAPEWILHQISGSTGTAVRVNGFGRETRMTGVEDKGGVGFLAELASVNGQGGSFSTDTVTQYSFPWRGIAQSENVRAFVNLMIAQLPARRPVVQVADNGAQTVGDFNSWPFMQSYQLTNQNEPELTQMMFWPWVLGGEKLRLTQLQTADRDETYYLSCTYNGAIDHKVQAQYFRVFTEQKRAAWLSMVTKGGPNSLAAYVLGPDYLKASLFQRGPRDQHVVTPDQRTYLPWQLAVAA